MQSAVNSGLKQKILEHYKREIIQTYGFKHLITMTILENAGLIKIQVNMAKNVFHLHRMSSVNTLCIL